MAYRDWKIQLNESGVPDEIIEYGGLRANGKDKVEYPCMYPPRLVHNGVDSEVVYDTVYRWRRLPDAVEASREAGRKTQRFGNPQDEDLPGGVMPTIYTPDFVRLRSEVRAAGGVLKLYEGDKDTWTSWAAGFLNSAGLFAASSHIDHTVLDVLKDLGVKHVDFFPDGDFAGLSAAEKMLDVFSDSSITISIKSMRMYVDDVRTKDTTDIWLAVDQDPQRHRAILSGLGEMKLATKRQRELAESSEYFISTLYERIEQEFASRTKRGSTDYSNHGWSKEAIPCPFHDHEHDDTSPAFYWHKKKKFGFCHKRGEQFLAKDVAEAFGINVGDYVNNNHSRSAPPSIKTPDAQIQTDKDKKSEPSPTMLNLGTSHLEKIYPLAEQYDQMPDESLIMSLDDALDDFEMRYKGQMFPEYPPVEMPVDIFHHLGGMGRVIQRPAMLGVLGLSGGYKTTFLTWVVNILAYKGYNVIVWSPEWSPERNADRIVQQHGGLSMWQMSMFERYHWEQEMIRRGELVVDDNSVFGAEPSDEAKSRTDFALHKIRSEFKGKIVYLKDFAPSIYHLAAQIMSVHKRMSAAGKEPQVLVIDYAQMAAAPLNVRVRWQMEDTITVLKNVTLLKGFATFVSSQVRKSDAEAVMAQKGFLGSTSGLNFRDQQFNFFWTLSPVPEHEGGTIVLSNGETRQVLKAAVVKNSLGKTAKDENNLIKLYVDTKRMLIHDTPEGKLGGHTIGIALNDPSLSGEDDEDNSGDDFDSELPDDDFIDRYGDDNEVDIYQMPF